jgi:predicted ATPase
MATVASRHDNGHLDAWTKPPFLRRVRIRGYKSIAFCDVALQPLTVLVGRNGAGKSNFLDALGFLRDALETNVSEAAKRRGGWSSIAFRPPSTPKIVFEIEAEFVCGRSRWYTLWNGRSTAAAAVSAAPNLTGHSFVARYVLELAADQHALAAIEREALELVDQATGFAAGFEVREGAVTKFRSKPDSGLPLPVPQPGELLLSATRPDHLLVGFIGTQPFLELADGLRFMGFYNFHPEAIRRLHKPRPGTLLERDGSNLASAIEGLREISPDTVDRVRDYLALVTDEVARFEVKTYDEVEGLRFYLKSGPADPPVPFDAASMSDGTLRALAALMAAFQIHLPSGGPTVVGIEEPETSLHPAAVRALVDALDEATQRTQVLLTTHSADLLSGRDLTPGQVLVVRHRGGQTHITPVDPASRQTIEKELYSLAELQRMDQLDLDEADLKRQSAISNGAREG